MEPREASLVDRIALGAVLVAASARALVAFAPLAVFDLDPALDASPFVGAAPGESVLIDSLALAGAGWILGRSLEVLSWAGRIIACGVLAAAFAFGWHSLSDAEQLWRGATGITGAVAACAIVMALRRDHSRTLAVAAVAALVGVGVIMAVRGLAQMLTEHQSMVAYYETTREAFLRAQGWLVDSPQALAYERRLHQNEPTAWFGFANVFATAAGGVAVLLGSIVLLRDTQAETRRQIGPTVVLVLAALVCAGLVIASGSKGGVAAVALGAGVIVVARRHRAWMPWILAGLPLVVLVAIAVRGAMGSEWGERSLLFRWHYLVGAARTLAGSPALGVGPAGFQSAFLLTRPEASVEEVQSAHAAIPDLLVSFGVVGVGLVALQFVLAWRAGRGIATTRDSRAIDERAARELALAVVALTGVVSIAFEAPALDGAEAFAWRLGGLGAGLLVSISAVRTLASADARGAAAIGLAALAAVIVVHGEVDMAFFLPGSAMWMWVALAIAAGFAWTRDPSSDGQLAPRWLRMAIAAPTLLAAAGLALWVAPALRLQDALAVKAARAIHERAESGSAAGLAQSRADGALALRAAAEIWPARHAYGVRAAEQWQAAAALVGDDAITHDWLLHAAEAARWSAGVAPTAFGGRLAGSLIAIRRAQLGHASWEEAAVALEAVLLINARHTESWIRLSDALARSGDVSGARAAAAMALVADDSYALDPLRQLPDSRRRPLMERAVRAP